jgi:anti-sigma-K factor RskA
MMVEDRHIEDLLPAYAMGSLDKGELAVVQKHLRACASCRAVLMEYEEVVGALGFAVPPTEPSPELKDRVLAGLKRRRRVPFRRGAGRLGKILFGPKTATVWATTGVIVVIFLVSFNVVLWLRLHRAETASPRHYSQVVELSSTESAPGAMGIIIYRSGDTSATLIVEDLPELSPARQYQLWLIRDGRRTSGGVFSVSPQGYATLLVSASVSIDSYQAFGITVEPAGGSPGPTGPKVLGS